MKKNYVKPIIIFESFSLSTNIAGDCDEIIKNATENACPYIDRSENKIFTTNLIDICTDYKNEDGHNGICYHIPTEGKELFNS